MKSFAFAILLILPIQYGYAQEVSIQATISKADSLYDKANSATSDITADKLITDAIRLYERVSLKDPDNASIWYKLAEAYSLQTFFINPVMVSAAYDHCYDAYARVTELSPNNGLAWFKWADALTNQAQSLNGQRAAMLYKESFEKYKKASTINQFESSIYNNWSVAASNYAQHLIGKNSSDYFETSFRLSEKATSLAPRDYKNWVNWGTALLYYAGTKSDDESYALYLEARKKFQKVMELHPNQSVAKETIEEINEYLRYNKK